VTVEIPKFEMHINPESGWIEAKPAFMRITNYALNFFFFKFRPDATRGTFLYYSDNLLVVVTEMAIFTVL
jgi:hypothetical protein